MKKSDIQVATPCGQDWQSMAPRDKSRFCGECKKVVHDLRSMKEKDAKKLLSTPSTEGLCVRYMYDEVGNVWFADTMFMRTEGLLKKVAATAALAAAPFLTACMGAYGGEGPFDSAQQDQPNNTDPNYPGIPGADAGADANPNADAAPLPSCGDTDGGAPTTGDAAAPDPNADPDAAVDPDPNADPDAAVDPNGDPDPNADPDAGIDPGPNADDAGVPAADDDAGLPPDCHEGRDGHGHRVRRCIPDGGLRRRH